MELHLRIKNLPTALGEKILKLGEVTMLTTKKPSQFSPLALAYIGDGVYELFVRTRIIEEHENLPANKLHKKTVQYVKAHAQSNSIDAMLEHMTDDETAVYKRGRNANRIQCRKTQI